MSGRYVVTETSWDHWKGPQEGWLRPALENGGVPTGTTIASSAEAGGLRYEHQWLALRFATARRAAQWVEQQQMLDRMWGEPADYPRFPTLREVEEHLDDVSMLQFMGIAG